MTTNRPLKKLGEIVKFSQGIQVPIEEQHVEQKPGFVRFLRIIDFTQGGQEHRYIENIGDRYFVNENELSMVRYGATTGFICTGKSGIIANNLFKITPKIDMNSKFIYYFFKSSVFQNYLNSAIFGAAMPAINFSGLNDLELPLPPLATQKLIVAKLDEAFASLDESIKLTQENINHLDEVTKSVLDKVFEEGNWEKKMLENIIEKKDLGLVKGANEQGPHKKYKYIKMNNISMGGKLMLNKTINVDIDDTEADRFKLNYGDFLFNTRNSFELVGKSCIFDIKNNETYLYNNNILRLRFSKNINPFFINYAFLADSQRKQLEKMKSGTTNVSAIYYKDLKGLNIPLPTLSKQQEIVAHLDEVFAQTKQLKTEYEAKLQQLKELKASVLQSAFEGKLV